MGKEFLKISLSFPQSNPSCQHTTDRHGHLAAPRHLGRHEEFVVPIMYVCVRAQIAVQRQARLTRSLHRTRHNHVPRRREFCFSTTAGGFPLAGPFTATPAVHIRTGRNFTAGLTHIRKRAYITKPEQGNRSSAVCQINAKTTPQQPISTRCHQSSRKHDAINPQASSSSPSSNTSSLVPRKAKK